MALTDENNSGIPATMLVGPTNGGLGGNSGFGGDWGWIILILLLAGNGGWGNGFGGGFGNAALGYDFPWLMNGQQNINTNTNSGFRDAMINDGITSVRDGIGNLATQLCGCCGDMQNSMNQGFSAVQQSLCNGFAGTTAAVTGAQNALAQQLYANQISDLERSFAAQTASTQGMTNIQSQLAQCCCDNRLATNDLKYTIATENCADRAALSEGIRDILTATQAQNQRILDQLCADKIEQKNDIIAQLRSELTYARGQASQDVQTAAIQAGQRALANEVEQYVAPSPRPAYIVQNPNCCAPTGCGCNGGF